MFVKNREIKRENRRERERKVSDLNQSATIQTQKIDPEKETVKFHSGKR